MGARKEADGADRPLFVFFRRFGRGFGDPFNGKFFIGARRGEDLRFLFYFCQKSASMDAKGSDSLVQEKLHEKKCAGETRAREETFFLFVKLDAKGTNFFGRFPQNTSSYRRFKDDSGDIISLCLSKDGLLANQKT